MIKNALFLFVVLAAVFVVYLPSYMQMQDLRRRNEVFEKRIKELEVDNVTLAEERDRLKNDPDYFEKVAREQLGIIKEGEVVYKVVPKGMKTPEPVEESKKAPAKTVVKKEAQKSAAKKSVKKPADKKKDTKNKTAAKSTSTKKAADTKDKKQEKD